jgi:hypothetical protein
MEIGTARPPSRRWRQELSGFGRTKHRTPTHSVKISQFSINTVHERIARRACPETEVAATDPPVAGRRPRRRMMNPFVLAIIALFSVTYWRFVLSAVAAVAIVLLVLGVMFVLATLNSGGGPGLPGG